MTEEFKEAQDIADTLEEQIKIVDIELSQLRVLKLAIYTAGCMKAITPMYIGNLNPKWKQYDTVIEILKDRINNNLLHDVIDCSTCKHQEVSKYVKPCYGCRDNDGYDNHEISIK